MRKLLLILLLLPFTVFAYPQTIKVQHDAQGRIYLVYSDFQKINPTTNPEDQTVQIKPITCKFSTNYNGNIGFAAYLNPELRNVTLSKDKPFIHTFTKPIYLSSETAEMIFYSYGCNSGLDGARCIQAKQQRLDDLIINCN